MSLISSTRNSVDLDSTTDAAQPTSEAEQEFRQAIREYQEASGRMFPTWSEILEVLQSLGYRKPGPEPTATSG